MDEVLRDNWNAVVKPTDKVYHLGDVYVKWPYKEPPERFLRSLNGHKHLILGNHDKGKDYNLWWSFDKISLIVKLLKFNLILTHMPLAEYSFESQKFINVHGHVHEKEPYNEKYRNVSVERINYRPINIDEIQ